MTREQKQTLFDLSLSLISDLTEELNNELQNLSVDATEDENNNVFVNCEGTLAKLNARFNQLKRTADL